MEKIFLSASPLSGSAHSSFPPLACQPLSPPFSLQSGPAPAPDPATARAPSLLAAATDKAALHSVTLPGGAQWSGPSSTSCPSRTRAEPQPPRAFSREQSLLRPTLPLYIPAPLPRNPLSPPSASRRIKARQNRRRDPSRSHLATAARSNLRERLAGLRLRRAKSPRPSFRALLLCTPR